MILLLGCLQMRLHPGCLHPWMTLTWIYCRHLLLSPVRTANSRTSQVNQTSQTSQSHTLMPTSLISWQTGSSSNNSSSSNNNNNNNSNNNWSCCNTTSHRNNNNSSSNKNWNIIITISSKYRTGMTQL